VTPRGVVPDIPRLAAEVRRRAPNADSPVHGDEHWRRTAAAGLRLLAPGVDPAVVLLFALLHDAARSDDGPDPDHGRHAAVLVDELRDAGLITLSEAQATALRVAVAEHADGLVTDRPTIGACWDADRLGLSRVGVRPDPRLLSTEAARDPGMIAWARRPPTPSWDELGRSYDGGVSAPRPRIPVHSPWAPPLQSELVVAGLRAVPRSS
jgi:uncharacterized protein